MQLAKPFDISGVQSKILRPLVVCVNYVNDSGICSWIRSPLSVATAHHVSTKHIRGSRKMQYTVRQKIASFYFFNNFVKSFFI